MVLKNLFDLEASKPKRILKILIYSHFLTKALKSFQKMFGFEIERPV